MSGIFININLLPKTPWGIKPDLYSWLFFMCVCLPAVSANVALNFECRKKGIFILKALNGFCGLHNF